MVTQTAKGDFMKNIFQTFVNPPKEFTQIPWWFWNDEITEDGIREQLTDFRQQGIYGFTIHARMGLSDSIPYLGNRWFELVRFAVEEAAKHEMIVHLYDEGMYPSGSAHGQVVEGHPEFLARGLEMRHIDRTDEFELSEQEKCVAILLDGQTEAIPIESTSQIPHSKSYRAFVITLSGGVIRGVHEGEEDSEPGAPLAADLLNPEAVQRFIKCTHERYYQEVGEYFGKTIQAFFTDEPSIMGRRAKRGLKPWTDGLGDYFQQKRGYDLIPLLPALWEDIGPETQEIRKDYNDVVAERLNESFYKQLSEWCEEHKIALTGHPAASDDIGPLRYFQLPGQDMVWRYVEPEKATALEGAHSTVGKCSSSAARHKKARRNGNEVYGAYGWNLNLDEMKWLADWLMARGVNLFWPHAFYYSVRDYRAYERPPDLGRHNLWWEHYHIFANYTNRIFWLLTDSEQVCDIAILAHHNRLPWEPAKVLFQNQWDFNYLEDRLLPKTTIENGQIKIGKSSYSTLVRMKGHILDESDEEIVENFACSGGQILDFEPEEKEKLIKQLEESLPKDVTLKPANSELRYIHVRKAGYDFYYLTNEGSNTVQGELIVQTVGQAEWWDALTGKSVPAVVLKKQKNLFSVALNLSPRESRILAINPKAEPVLQPDWSPMNVVQTLDLSKGWKLYNPDTKELLAESLIDWTTLDGYDKFSGTLIYEKEVEISSQHMIQDGKYILDLGEVHDFAEVCCNGKSCSVRLWKPFRFEVPLKKGFNSLNIAVTNSMANRMKDAALPSGMLGPVTLELIKND